MNKKIEISILDLGNVSAFNGHDSALQSTIDCAILADKLEYKRYWLGENYVKTVAWNYPVPLLSVLGGYTNNIRIGAGGVLIKHHSPYKIGSDFSLLSTLFSNRIDLGIVGSSIDNYYENVLDVCNNNYKENILNLLDFIENDTLKEKKMFNPYHKNTSTSLKDNLWILGSGRYSIINASENNLSYCYSIFHSTKELNRENYQFFLNQKSQFKQSSIAVAGVCLERHTNAIKAIDDFKNKFYVPTVYGNKIEVKEKLNYYRRIFTVNEFVFFILSENADEKIETINILSEIIHEINIEN